MTKKQLIVAWTIGMLYSLSSVERVFKPFGYLSYSYARDFHILITIIGGSFCFILIAKKWLKANRKQSVVIWIMGISICTSLVIYFGDLLLSPRQNSFLFRGIIMPMLITGCLFIYTLRDRKKQA